MTPTDEERLAEIKQMRDRPKARQFMSFPEDLDVCLRQISSRDETIFKLTEENGDLCQRFNEVAHQGNVLKAERDAALAAVAGMREALDGLVSATSGWWLERRDGVTHVVLVEPGSGFSNDWNAAVNARALPLPTRAADIMRVVEAAREPSGAVSYTGGLRGSPHTSVAAHWFSRLMRALAALDA